MGTPEKPEDIKFIPVVKRYDYSVDGKKNLIYAGFAERLTLTSATVWKINKYTYDVDSDIILIQTGYGSWDSRATLVYG